MEASGCDWTPVRRTPAPPTPCPTTTNGYDGDALALEYNGSNAVLDRYVHGGNAAADDPLVWYQGSNLNNPSWLHADHLGSIVGWTDRDGANAGVNSYDEYGIPGSTNSTALRFGYTGQAWIPELGMYYYKARIYSQNLGRFMQTDPIGYEGGVNLYGYVANDPVNHGDPTGLVCTVRDQTLTCTVTVPKNLTKEQISEAKRILNNYTKTVAKMLGSEKIVRVPEMRGAKGTAFDISSREVGRSLANREIYFRPGQTDRDALLSSGGSYLRPGAFTTSGNRRCV